MNNAILTVVGLAIAIASADARSQADAAVKDKAQTCAACHGPNGNSTDPQYPILAGQTARYIFLELRDFKAGRRHAVRRGHRELGAVPREPLGGGRTFRSALCACDDTLRRFSRSSILAFRPTRSRGVRRPQ